MNEKLVKQLVLTIKGYDDHKKRIATEIIESLCNCCVLETASVQEQSFADAIVCILREIKND